MSRIGKQPIPVPEGVTVTVTENAVLVAGAKGRIEQRLPAGIGAALEGRELTVYPVGESRKTAALWGLSRSLVANAVQGVSSGFEKQLEFEGIGFRAALDASGLALQLGFSHPVKFPAPEGISFKVEKNMIAVSGIRKDLVGETAARIRALKPPEPYKGKGIRYRGEVIRRKAGKKAVASA